MCSCSTLALLCESTQVTHELFCISTQSEEFFRLLCTRRNGVPLNSVNAISNPTTGVYDIAKATFRRHCSAFLASTILVAFLIVATSALAPAACKRSLLSYRSY